MEIKESGGLAAQQTWETLQSKKEAREKTSQEGRTDTAELGSPSSGGVGTYTPTGKASGAQAAEKKMAVTLESIKIEIQKQAFALLTAQADESGDGDSLREALARFGKLSGNADDPLGLGDYFTAHPDDWAQVQAGEIPDYFNVENTGQRILDIWMRGVDGQGDVAAWAENTKALIGQAYDEVSGMVGGLPDIVQQTRDYIMNQLDAYVERQTQGGAEAVA